jgi:microsomal dipeptidase-like Zn-dependent dipeptidase
MKHMTPYIDIHCHPTLKHYLYGHSVYKKGQGSKDSNYSNIQVTEPAMRKAGINAVLAAHYLPEKQIKDDWKVIAGEKLVKKLVEKYVDKLEPEDAFARTIEMIEDFEELITEDNRAMMAHNFSELEEGIREDRRVFIHTIEGAHHLGRGLGIEAYAAHIAELESRGVAMLTLLHFFPNDVTTPTEGLPPMQKHLVGMQYKPQPSPLSDTGRKVVELLLQSRIIVDLTHTNQEARTEIFNLNAATVNKPLVFSHTGVRALFKDTEYPEFSFICPDDDELIQVRNCNGVVGVIMMNYFLCGKEEKPLSNEDDGLKYVLATIKHIADVTGSFDHISIGTDFDGMTDPPDDLYKYKMLEDLSTILYVNKEYLGATDEDIEKIKGGNMLRVLKQVWK